ncbi:MAG: PaaI family thioesterase [Prevotella sp.]
MNIDDTVAKYIGLEGLEKTLGMEFVSTTEADTVMARMPVDSRNVQPYGYLNGGATVALAETLAGLGSLHLAPGNMCVGMNISASHLKPAKRGDTVTALARIVHRGRQTHLWRVDVSDGAGHAISTVNVTNFIIAREGQEE